MATQTVETYQDGVLVATETVTIPAETEARDGRRRRVRQAVTVLGQWAEQARTVEAQGGNVTQAQLKALFGRFGTLCDRLADMIEGL